MSGRTTKRPGAQRGPSDELPSLRQRSPWVYWMAVLVLAGVVATVLAGVIAGITR